MLRILFAVGIAGLVFAGGSGTTQAAPILPLPAAATAGIDNMMGDGAGVTAGGDCAVVRDGGPAGDLVGVLGALLLAGVLAGARVGAEVATAGVTVGAVCVAGGDSNHPT
jgi:hypothetical protein